MIRKITVYALLMVLPLVSFAQTDNDNKKAVFKGHLRAKETKRKNAVKAYAEQNKIPITGAGAEGEYMYLHHIDNNKPVYYTTRVDNKSNSVDMLSRYVRIGNGEWRPLENNIKLEKVNSAYFSIKSSEPMRAVYLLNSEGRSIYKSKSMNTTELSIATRKMKLGEYVLCIKTSQGFSSKTIIIN